MHSTKYSRCGVIAWSPEQVKRKGLIVGDFSQHFDLSSTESRLEFVSTGDIHRSDGLLSPTVSVPSTHRFNELVWAPTISESHPSGLVFGGTEDGSVVFFDADSLMNKQSLSIVSARRDHQGHVLSVDFSSDYNWAISGGGGGQLLLWNLHDLSTPFSPGTPNFHDQVKIVRWNRKMSQILASLTSHRISLWDMRRSGAPILEFGELGGGCDWSDLCWNPSDASSLIVCSQSDVMPYLQKWDLRYPTAAIKEYPIHHRGITAIDWHPVDPRLLLSASIDGQTLITNSESGEVVGRVHTEQTDRVRRVKWSPCDPDLVVVQYYQNPIQISSIKPIGVKKELNTDLPVELSLIPSWVSAAPVGSSFGFGGKMASHYREWNETTQSWIYSVDIKQLPVDPVVYNDAVQLQHANDSRQLAAYCQDKALSATDEVQQIAWSFLSTLSSTKSKDEIIRILGFRDASNLSDPTSSSAHLNSSSSPLVVSNVMSGSSDANPTAPSVSELSEDGHEDALREVFQSTKQIEWQSVDQHAWSLLDNVINLKESEVIDGLLQRKDFVAALLYTRERPKLFAKVVQAYVEENLDANQRLLATVACDASLTLRLPPSEWKRELALLLIAEHDLTVDMRKLAFQWKDSSARSLALLPAILSCNSDVVLMTNTNLPLEERIAQSTILSRIKNKGKIVANGPFIAAIKEYCDKLISHGVIDLAWMLIKDVESDDMEINRLRHSIFKAVGGTPQTQSNAPADPDENERKSYAYHLSQANNIAAAAARQVSAPINPSNNISQQGYSANKHPMVQSAWAPPSPNATFAPPGVSSHPLPNGYPPSNQTAMPLPPTTNPFAPPNSSYTKFGPPVPQPPSYGVPPIEPPPSTIRPPPMQPPPQFAPPNPYPSTQPTPMVPPPTMGYNNQHGAYGAMQPPPMQPPLVQPPQQNGVQAYGGMPPPSQPPPANGFTSIFNQQTSTPPLPSPSVINQKPISSAPGWNDPPPLPSKKIESRPPSVMSVQWKPLEQPNITNAPFVPNIQSGISTHQASPTSVQQQQQQVPEVQLNEQDKVMIDKLYQLAQAIVATGSSSVNVRKAEDAKARLGIELAPRLATGKLSEQTRGLLWQACDHANRGDFQSAQAMCGQLVRTGGDFVEVSAFLPALKSLFTAGSATFSRR